MNFAVLEPPAKVFSMKLGCAVPTYDRFSILRKYCLHSKSFLRKMVILRVTLLRRKLSRNAKQN